MSFSLEHYFRGCDLIERLWRCAVNRNQKTKAVNEKLDVWHRQNPDKPISVAAWRIANARRRSQAKRTDGAAARATHPHTGVARTKEVRTWKC